MKQCRYLEEFDGEVYCVYWDMPLRGDEDLRCCATGWECYEEPARGCVFEGQWMTLAEYADYLESKSERELPEGYEFQDFRLDSKGMAELLRPRMTFSAHMGAKLRFLPIRPEYPRTVKAATVALVWSDRGGEEPHVHGSECSQWVTSLRVVDGACQVELVGILEAEGLEFADGYCSHGEDCPTVERLKRTILTSEAFGQLREDLVRELSRTQLADHFRADPPREEFRV
jgi:hypothetical protein